MKVELLPDDQVGRFNFRGLRCTADHANSVYSTADLIRKPELKKCKHGAVVRVDGKPMCRIHAGFHTLKVAVDKGEI